MGATLLVDSRAAVWRRRLGPVAWLALEEAALSAADVEGRLWAAISARELSSRLGLGVGSGTRALRELVAVGLLVRADAARRGDGRFAGGGYWLRLPDGLAVAGVTAADRGVLSASGMPVSGVPEPGIPITETARAKPGSVAGAPNVGRQPGLRDSCGSTGQAQLFAIELSEGVSGGSVDGLAPRIGGECFGAVVVDGCEGVNRVHELAPGVPIRPSRASIPGEGEGRC
jgi:hypothetical protein